MLALDDERWKQLSHRGLSGGRKSELDSDAPYIPDVLRELFANPHDRELFDGMIPYLCSEGTTWPAAYAATPYIVELASRVSPPERANYLIWVGLIVIDSIPAESVDELLRDDYVKALKSALPLLLETFMEELRGYEIRYLLAALAALKGYLQLGEILANLDTYSYCQECDSELFDLAEVMQKAN